MLTTPIHERLQSAAGDRTFRRLGEMTSTHPETVRRYMQGHAPSVEFLAEVCQALAISGDWLLTGSGPMKRDQIRRESLRQADPSELLSAMAGTIEALADRVERLERYVQTLEVRLRAGRQTQTVEAKPNGSPDADRPRVQRVADAITKRSRSNDH